MTKCAVLGASGHGKVIAELALLNGYSNIEFFDDRWPQLSNVEHWVVKGNTGKLLNEVDKYEIILIGIGDNQVRLQKQLLLESAGGCFTVLAHPSAQISQFSTLGVGTVVMANAVINGFTNIGKSCIVNSSATVDHDCNIADGVHFCPGSNVAGGVNVGLNSFIGIGSKVKQSICIGSNVVVGAGSTVIQNVLDDQTVIGTPAKQIK